MFHSADSINGSWSFLAPLPDTLWGVTSYYLPDSNKIFICAGADNNGNAHAGCFIYDIATNTYLPRASLPVGRFSGKLVRVRDSLYLVGSANTSFIPDGALYRYDLKTNTWLSKSPTPSPYLHEMAVCVLRDSVIIAIGGSDNGFNGTNSVRIYNPFTNIWSILTNEGNLYPDYITSANAECIGNNIVVVGGFGMTGNYVVTRGYVPGCDTCRIENLSWRQDTSSQPFPYEIYRLSSGQWGSFMVFGPGLYNDSLFFNQIWGFNIADSTWTSFSPNPIDTIADIPNISIKASGDSVMFYIFGGVLKDTSYPATAHAERYSAINPIIGIASRNKIVPSGYTLHQNYPNPFNSTTIISYDLPKAGLVHLSVYDILGREVRNLVNTYQRSGTYEIRFDASNLASGIYFFRIYAGEFTQAKKMVLLK